MIYIQLLGDEYPFTPAGRHLGHRRAARGVQARSDMSIAVIADIASGKLTVCYWTWPFIVDFPIKMVIFPLKWWFSIVMLVYRRVNRRTKCAIYNGYVTNYQRVLVLLKSMGIYIYIYIHIYTYIYTYICMCGIYDGPNVFSGGLWQTIWMGNRSQQTSI